jgi:putative colanic acid biosynthesis glycosyltransferase
MPLISIVTVVCNNKTGLIRTWSSISSQSTGDFEWIIIDGESTDGTKEFASSLQFPFVKVISEPMRGIYSAMNMGLEASNSSFVVFLNAGDTFTDRHTLEEINPLLLREDIDLLYGDSLLPFENGKIPAYKPAWGQAWITYGMFSCHQAMYFRRSVIGDMRYDSNFMISGDYDFTARFLKKSDRILHLHLPLCVIESFGVSERKREIGRRENWSVQRSVLHMSCLHCAIIRLVYLAMWVLRHNFSGLYGLLRFKRNKSFQ